MPVAQNATALTFVVEDLEPWAHNVAQKRAHILVAELGAYRVVSQPDDAQARQVCERAQRRHLRNPVPAKVQLLYPWAAVADFSKGFVVELVAGR